MATNFDDTLLPGIAIPPGEILQEELEYRGIAEDEFARQIGISPQDIADIFLGKKAITQDIADAIERELGISAYLWVKMEASYQFILSRLKEDQEREDILPYQEQRSTDRYPNISHPSGRCDRPVARRPP